MTARFALIIFLASCLGVSTFGQSGRVQQTPTPVPDNDTERVFTEEIKLNVLAFDNNGDFFRDVTADDLVIREDNILHQPTSVRRIPASVLIVMDTGGDLRSVKTLDRTRQVAAKVIGSLRPGDVVAILEYNEKPGLVQEWTADRQQALAAIKRTNFGRRSAFTAALEMAIRVLMADSVENRHLVLITDGTDTVAVSSAKFDAIKRLLSTDISVHVLSYASMEAAALAARTKNTSTTPPPQAVPDEVAAQLPNGVNPKGRTRIGPTINLDRTLIRQMRNRKADLEASEKQLESLSRDSNGEFIVPATIDEMIDKAALVARMIDASYLVTYTPKKPVVPTYGVSERVIDVTSKRSGLTVQARRRLLIPTAPKR